jgi:hypothetical protein
METNGYSQNKIPTRLVMTNDFLDENFGIFWINLVF